MNEARAADEARIAAAEEATVAAAAAAEAARIAEAEDAARVATEMKLERQQQKRQLEQKLKLE